ncbi:hypothetical protein TNCV_2149541 [Trichonephila clavipes]|nr:hypothetical protein TNCV_2149541 [Trichonephila clavipes]
MTRFLYKDYENAPREFITSSKGTHLMSPILKRLLFKTARGFTPYLECNFILAIVLFRGYDTSNAVAPGLFSSHSLSPHIGDDSGDGGNHDFRSLIQPNAKLVNFPMHSWAYRSFTSRVGLL